MELALIIDKDSIFNTYNFKRILNEIEDELDVKIYTYVYLKRYFQEDFICSLTDKYNSYFDKNKYNVYKLYEDSNIQEFLNNDLFYYYDYKDYEYEELFYYEKKVIKDIVKKFIDNNKLYLESRKILNDYYNVDNDYVFKNGKTKILLSAPHNVVQYMNGVYKKSDFGTGTIVVSSCKETNCYSIIKTKTVGNVFKNDNANKQVNCKYRTKIKKSVKENNLKALLDIHSLRMTRKEEINIGIDNGNNIFHNDKLLNDVVKIIEDNGFKVSVDKPFKAGYPSISNFASQDLNIHSIQIEINSKFINYNFKNQRYNDLVKMINEMVIYLDNYIK